MNIAINGFGRIGRSLTRVLHQRPEINLVAINELAPVETMAHLLKYDSTHGRFPAPVEVKGENLVINGKEVRVFHEPDPARIPWRETEVDVVIEATGRFKNREAVSAHLKAGAPRVILSVPPEGNGIPMVVLGVNDEVLETNPEIISNASCTTNNAAPMIKVINNLCGIEQAFVTTVHSYTADQRLQDAPHKDLRRARGAAQSIVPTTTGAAKALTGIFPELNGRLGGCGIRVPVPDGSLTDITFTVKREVTLEEVNAAFLAASQSGPLSGVLGYTGDPIVSSDVIGSPYSCLFDELLTSVLGRMVKVVGWYDNEMGYSHRLADLILKLSAVRTK